MTTSPETSVIPVSDNGAGEILPQVMNNSQVAILTMHTPRNEVRYRKGKGGRDYPYTDPAYVIRTLNEAFGYDWDFEIVKDELIEVGGKPFEFSVLGKLAIKVGGHTIVKTQYGSQTIEFVKKDGEPTNEPVSIGDAKKGAASDALKKCASEVGVALDIYDSDSDLYKGKPISVIQFDLLKRWVETCEEASQAGIRENFNISNEDTRETIISRGKTLKLLVDTRTGKSKVQNQPENKDEEVPVSADTMVVIAGKAFPKDKPIGAKAVNGTEADWFKLHIIGSKYFADKNGKFVRSHYDNHLKSHFNLSSASNLTGEMLKALYDHINGVADDMRWYQTKKVETNIDGSNRTDNAGMSIEESTRIWGLEGLYQDWRSQRVTTPEDQMKLDGIFSNLFEFVEKYPVNIKTPEGIAELNKHIEDAWR